ncbi:MAG: hypothetical protein A2X86_16495 [Bdellovibrionales bacterium GWA2_49_15]|nr:MAG: hypothetical protein A2X86_16495 [Bdellovibrionales bacterium GWA2_49_15]HAZ13705.1 hypothetical protein [Bdellovibrionales bacterium]
MLRFFIAFCLLTLSYKTYASELEAFIAAEQEATWAAFKIDDILQSGGKISATLVYEARKHLGQVAVLAQELKSEDADAELAFQVQKLESAYRLHRTYLVMSPKLRTFFRDQWTDPGAGLTPFREFLRLNLYPRHAEYLDKKLRAYAKQEHPDSDAHAVIVASMPYGLVTHKHSLTILTPGYVPVVAGFRDMGIDLWTMFSNKVSGIYGNVVGKVKWRQGWLKDNEKALEMFRASLKPLDLIVNKTGNKLTDLNIPGNFGHAAIYLGTEEQLKQLGLWDRPEFKDYHRPIRQGLLVMEMTRHGLGFASLEETLEADEIAVMRVDAVAKGERDLMELYTHALAQRNKTYDFNFDANTTTRITCTEFVAQTFDFLPWGSNVILGRHAITPDHVAQMVQDENAGVELVLYLKGGAKKRVQQLDAEAFRQLIR